MVVSPAEVHHKKQQAGVSCKGCQSAVRAGTVKQLVLCSHAKARLQEEICAKVAGGRAAGHRQVGLECHKAGHGVRAHSEADGVRRSEGKARERYIWRWYKRSCGTQLAQQHSLHGVQRVLRVQEELSRNKAAWKSHR